MSGYTVCQVGLGPRGRCHVDGFLRNPDRYEVAALCDVDTTRLEEVSEEFGIATTYTDAETMLAEVRPDVFCFVTQPDVRLGMVELGVKHGVKAIVFEKPMATSLAEARTITELCRQHGIKAIVSHQQKYLTSMQKLDELVRGGEVGEVLEIHATAQANFSQLGTHFMDYTIWINGGARAEWVTGHVHGRENLTDSHPSSDWLLGRVKFDNGVRAFIECGYLAPSHMDADHFWTDNRLTVYGTHGYAWADTDGRWGAFTRSSGGEMIDGAGDPWAVQEAERLQPLYLKDLADWLDDDDAVHPCNVDLACHGFEILEGICLSALDNTRMDLPLAATDADRDALTRMRNELPDVPGLDA